MQHNVAQTGQNSVPHLGHKLREESWKRCVYEERRELTQSIVVNTLGPVSLLLLFIHGPTWLGSRPSLMHIQFGLLRIRFLAVGFFVFLLLFSYKWLL